MNEPRHTNSLKLLRGLRDMAKKRKIPWAAIIVLLALDDAKEGLTMAGLCIALGRPSNITSKVIESLLGSLLISQAENPHRAGSSLYFLTELGALELEKFLNPEAVPA